MSHPYSWTHGSALLMTDEARTLACQRQTLIQNGPSNTGSFLAQRNNPNFRYSWIPEFKLLLGPHFYLLGLLFSLLASPSIVFTLLNLHGNIGAYLQLQA